VAEGVETAAELAWLREHGADFAQGYHLGRPAQVPVGASVGESQRAEAPAA
jgi:EAL domain-containing protein (putative c-di-GMP-specific phosphodiesterase class I)